MTEALDAILAAHDLHDRTAKFFLSLGSSYEQAEAAAAAHKDKFSWDGVALNWKATNKLAADDPAAKAFFAQDAYRFLLPVPTTDANQKSFDRALADRAFVGTGNKTSAQNLIRRYGLEAATDIARQYGKVTPMDNKPGTPPTTTVIADEKTSTDKAPPTGDKHTGRNNPFSEAGWNISAQGRLIREIGLAAASSIAASAGAFVGQTRPNKAA